MGKRWILYSGSLIGCIVFYFAYREWFSWLALLAVLWVLVLLTIKEFSMLSERAGDLLIPYILWLSFALYLNFGVFVLN